jgi:hypothetical protein
MRGNLEGHAKRRYVEDSAGVGFFKKPLNFGVELWPTAMWAS